MDLENKLLREFLQISSTSQQIFQRTVDAIYQTLECRLCTLWKVNKRAKSVSLLAFAGYEPDELIEGAFVHPIEGSFSELVINETAFKGNGSVFIDDITKHPIFPNLKLRSVVESKKCKNCIAVKVPVHLDNSLAEALLFMYPNESDVVTPTLLSVITDYLSLSFSNYYLSRKERLTSSIIELHEKKGTKDIGSIIHPIINDILKDFIQYEGSSAFVWDPFLNRLNLSATTGMEGGLKKKDIYYSLGEGWTGKCAEEMRPMIINRPIDNVPGHQSKHREIKPHQGQSYLFIPIRSVLNKSLLGILRFVNKKNPVSSVLDMFSNTDLQLLDHVCYLIGLYMEFAQTEKVMSGFSKHMSHEILTPAIGIRGLASRLVENKTDQEFLDKYLSDYSESLFEYSSLQVAQTKSIEYIWRGNKDQPKNILYNVERVDTRELIESCKKLVFPLIRDEGLTFDNIIISGFFPVIYVDRFAFEPVFLNLLTNSIKYRHRIDKSSFKIEITGHDVNEVRLPDKTTNKGYLIRVTDWGMGIPADEKHKIFFLGYRRKDIERLEVRGLGMGLTVVKRILEDFFCYVWLSSTQKPTQFKIFIPSFLTNVYYTRQERWTSPPKANED